MKKERPEILNLRGQGEAWEGKIDYILIKKVKI